MEVYMDKKKSVILLSVIAVLAVCLVAGFFYWDKLHNGATAESRERVLQETKNGLTITAETEVNGYIVSSIYDTKHQQHGLAVFKPEGNGKYSLQTRTLRSPDEIVNCLMMTDETTYHLFYCDEANLDYAEITYTPAGKQPETFTLDVPESHIISFEVPEKDYSLNVVFYDTEGNKYE